MVFKQYVLKIAFALSLFLCFEVHAQTSGLTSSDLSNVKVDDLTDEQVQQFVSKFESSGMSWSEIDAVAAEKGMSASEIQKLKIRAGGGSSTSSKTSGSTSGKANESSNRSRTYTSEKKTTKSSDTDIFGEEKEEETSDDVPNVFGMSVFSKKKLTFTPNLNIPTPKNYQLGANDELILDVWGASQQTYTLKVTPEGSLLIPNVGHVYVSGMSIEEATVKLKKELSTIYSGLKTGTTFLKVSIGATVRSIKVNVGGDVHMPGTYTLPAFATAFHALYSAGGPSVNGSLRLIKVVRDNKTIAELDFYNFLVKGEQPGNIRLEDQDVVFVTPYNNRVQISGKVKRNGFYDMKEKETLKDLVSFSGGFTDNAYKQRFKIFRKTLKENKIIDISNAQSDTFTLRNGDRVFVDSLLKRFENRVEISGAVYRPGFFAIDEASTLKTLIEKADGLRGDVFLNRATLYRTNEDYTTEVQSIDLGALMKGSDDIKLKREDVIKIYSIFDLRQEYNYQIDGEVKRPGSYPFSSNTTLEDLISRAGGFRESASQARIEVARRIKKSEDESEKTAEIYQFSVSKDLKLNDSTSKFKLEPFDRVYVRRSPGYEVQRTVYVAGEVKYPGAYSLSSKADYISDLIERAGGLSKEAYPRGGTLIRKKVERINKRDFILRTLTNKDSLVLDSLYKDETIGISLEKILDHPKSKYDLMVMEGDILQVPKLLQTVRVSGSVLYPVSVRYNRGSRLRSYVSMAGGFAENAKKSKVYVIYPNGNIKRTHNLLVMKIYPRVEPGSEVVIPTKIPVSVDRWIGLGGSVATMVTGLVTTFLLVKSL